MSKVKMDLSKWKHVSSNGKTTKLRHADGHFLVLAQGGLCKDSQAQLKALAEGGEVHAKIDKEKLVKPAPWLSSNDSEELKRASDYSYTDAIKAAPERIKETLGMAEGGRVPMPETRKEDNKERAKAMMKGAQSGGNTLSQGIDNAKKEIKSLLGYASGGSVYKNQDEYSDIIHKPETDAEGVRFSVPAMEEGPESYDNSVAPALELEEPAPGSTRTPAEAQTPAKAIGQAVGEGIRAALGAQAQEPTQPMPAQAQPPMPAQVALPGSVNMLAPQDVSQVPQSPMVEAPQQQAPMPQQGLDQPALGQPGFDISKADPNALANQGLQQAFDANQTGAKAAQDLAITNEKIARDQLAVKQRVQADYDTQLKAIETERQHHIADIQAGYIDPQKYWNNHSKIATAIGIILAGFNPTNRPNAAIEFLKYQMDQNIEAQRQNLSAKQNLLSANLRQVGNLRDAVEMTRIMQNDIVSQELQAAAAKAQNPVSAAAAMQAASQLNMTASGLAQQMAQRRTIAQLTATKNQNPDAYLMAMQQIDPKRAADESQLLVPGVGFARSSDDAKILKETVYRRDSIKNNSAKAIEMIKKYGTYEALGPHNATFDSLVEQIATDQAKLIDPSSIARPGEVEMIKKTLASPGLFQQNSTAQKNLQNFYKTVDSRAQEAFKSRGLDIAPTVLPETTKNAKGEQYQLQVINGKKYYVPVK